MMKTEVCLFLCLAASACAHLCLISPHQRGSMDGLNQKASSDCFLVTSPCGDRPAQDPLELKASSNFTVTFQKNLDHWLQKTPGYFAVTLLDGDKETELARIPDKGEPSLTLYSLDVTMPCCPKRKNLILQATYVTKNPDAPAVFYQCTDIELY